MINTYGILWEQIKGGEEVFWFKKKGGKPKAAIFVDMSIGIMAIATIFR